MAPRAAQSGAVPRIANLTIGRREKKEAGHLCAVRPKARFVAVNYSAAAYHPTAMLATTPNWPSAADTVASIYRDGFAEGPKGPTADDPRVATIDLAGCRRGQITTKHTVAAANHDAPARGSIDSRCRLDDLNESDGVDLLAAKCSRNPKSKSPASARASTSGGDSRRARSLSSAYSAICGASACTALRYDDDEMLVIGLPVAAE